MEVLASRAPCPLVRLSEGSREETTARPSAGRPWQTLTHLAASSYVYDGCYTKRSCMEDSPEKLRAVIVYLITMLKSNVAMSARISAELASVTEAVRALDPTFDDVLEQNRRDVNQMLDPVARANLDRYDEMIRKVENGEIV
jgi:hypothetical protein